MSYKKTKIPIFFFPFTQAFSQLLNKFMVAGEGLESVPAATERNPFEQVAKLSHYPPFSLHKESNILYVNCINYLFNTLCAGICVDAP